MFFLECIDVAAKFAQECILELLEMNQAVQVTLKILKNIFGRMIGARGGSRTFAGRGLSTRHESIFQSGGVIVFTRT